MELSFVLVDFPDDGGEVLDILAKMLDILGAVPAIDLSVDERNLFAKSGKGE